jgi:cytochrome c oxidase assembly factor CtaG
MSIGVPDPGPLTGLDALLSASRCFGGGTAFGWSTDPALIIPLAAFVGLYAVGLNRLWARAGVGRGVRPGGVALFAAGWLVLVVALASPLHAASRSVFTAHMIEHSLVIMVGAPLLVMGRPLPVLIWALPKGWRAVLGLFGRSRAVGSAWAAATSPFWATALHGMAIWVWHVPGFFEGALTREWAHWLQHLSFLGTAVLFWWAVLACLDRQRAGSALASLFITALHTSLLGALLVFAGHPLYPVQLVDSARWGLDALEDQQLAGLVMWVPGGLVYAVAALLVLSACIRSTARRQERNDERDRIDAPAFV